MIEDNFNEPNSRREVAIHRLRLFQDIETAIFKSRPNRFVVECLYQGKTLRAYLPNPGRLLELLVPDSKLYLVKSNPASKGRLPFTVVAVDKEGAPVFLHTHLTNRVAQHLIEQQRIPGLEDYRLVRPEVTVGRSRFDFLLEKGETQHLLEVKSCTLFGNKIAMFPDAVTARGKKHLLELAALAQEGLKGGVLFVVHSPQARYFLPEFHTDLDFARTLCEVRDRLLIRAMSVKWTPDLRLGATVNSLMIPWKLIEKESHDSGSYMVILRLHKKLRVPIGRLGEIQFREGYYIYVGSAKQHLTKRIQRHQRKRKKFFWHIDYLRQHAEFCTALPVRARMPLECEIAKEVRKLSGWPIPGFGASDCTCPGHLFGFHTHPLMNVSFIAMLTFFRIDRLEAQVDPT